MIREHSMLDVALGYRAVGWYPVPIPHREKGPRIQGWQDLRLDSRELLSEHFNGKPQNIGVILGRCSGNIVDVDLDQPECLAFANWLLPATRRFGRRSNINSHWLFHCETDVTRKLFEMDAVGSDGRKRMVAEIRANRHQTVFPGSIHESGEPVLWTDQLPIAEIAFPDLERLTGRIAAGAVLAQAWPRQKSFRHDCELALAGMLLRAGWTDAEAERYIETIARLAGTENAAGRARNVIQTTRDHLNNDQACTGWKRLSELLKQSELIGKVPKWLHYDETMSQNGHATDRPALRIEPINDCGEENSNRSDLEPEPTPEAMALASVMNAPTEDNVALLFEQRYGTAFRYCLKWGFWLQWDGTRWRPEHTDLAFDFCRRIARSVNVKGKSAIAKRSFSNGVEGFARAARTFATLPDQWDPIDCLLNMPDGTQQIGEER